jgi:hypothetical protein
MAKSGPSTVAAYLASLAPERREAIAAVRDVIVANLPPGYEEGIQYGMIGYYVPLARYPDTYNGQPLGIAALASQKNYMALYLMTVYGDEGRSARFRDAYRRSGRKLDMGKSCVRFRSLDDLPLDLIGEVIAEVGVDEFLAAYEVIRAGTRTGKKKAPAKTKAPAKKTKASPRKK